MIAPCQGRNFTHRPLCANSKRHWKSCSKGASRASEHSVNSGPRPLYVYVAWTGVTPHDGSRSTLQVDPDYGWLVIAVCTACKNHTRATRPGILRAVMISVGKWIGQCRRQRLDTILVRSSRQHDLTARIFCTPSGRFIRRYQALECPLRSK